MRQSARPWAAIALAAVLGFPAIPACAESDWSAIAGSRMTYTDDVFQFSASRRQKFSEDPSQPTVVPTEKKADVVWDPSLEVVRTSTNALGINQISAKAHGFVYTDNPVFNHADYRLQMKQGLSPDTTVLVRYRYVPNMFLGPNFERRTGTRSIQDERVTSHTGRIEWEQKLGARWVVSLIGRGGLRLYNEAFAERDTQFWAAGPHVSYALFDRVTAPERGLQLGYSPEDVQRGLGYKKAIADETARMDIEAAAAALQGQSVRLLTGYCWGGYLSWRMACLSDTFAAASCWHGGGIARHCRDTARIPVQMHFGGRDNSIPLSDVEQIRSAQPQVEIHAYPDAGHSFGRDATPAYHADSAALAWERTLAFFARHA